MKWTKKDKAASWSRMIVAYHERLQEEKIITRWNWLVLEVGVLVIIILLLARG